jgi:hypothetical protein
MTHGTTIANLIQTAHDAIAGAARIEVANTFNIVRSGLPSSLLIVGMHHGVRGQIRMLRAARFTHRRRVTARMRQTGTVTQLVDEDRDQIWGIGCGPVEGVGVQKNVRVDDLEAVRCLDVDQLRDGGSSATIAALLPPLEHGAHGRDPVGVVRRHAARSRPLEAEGAAIYIPCPGGRLQRRPHRIAVDSGRRVAVEYDLHLGRGLDDWQ